MKKTTFSCDICKGEENVLEDKQLQVIFTTEQTEGRASEPYLSDERLDICKVCLSRVLRGNYIFAHGAQGYNTYYFKDKNS